MEVLSKKFPDLKPFSVEYGNIIKEIAADNSVEAFIDNNCKLLCSTGMIYDILQDDIVKEEEGFKFTIV